MIQPALRIASGVLALFLVTGIQAADSNNVVITQTAYGSLETGQIVKGWSFPGNSTLQPLAHVWQQKAYGNVGFDALIKKRLELNFTGEGLMAFSTPQIGLEPETMQPRDFLYKMGLCLISVRKNRSPLYAAAGRLFSV